MASFYKYITFEVLNDIYLSNQTHMQFIYLASFIYPNLPNYNHNYVYNYNYDYNYNYNCN